MPELPEVETVRRGLVQTLQGRRLARVLVRRPDLRFPLPPHMAHRLTGRRVERLDRRAKYILAHLDDGQVLLLHLGMSGRMTVVETPPGGYVPDTHDHIVLQTDAGATVAFNDARRFGSADLVAAQALDDHWLLKGLGPEPLDDGFTGPVLSAALAGRITPIKAALLDQRTVAGLGNIYVCEALFHARLSPKRSAHTVAGTRAERLVAAIKQVLARAIEAGGSTLRDYVQASGELGYFQHSFAVYGRVGEACPGCRCAVDQTGGIQRIVQSNRSTFYCPRRQR